ncbi:MAG: DUF4349 domain-containing protein [Bacteroidota bacterium]
MKNVTKLVSAGLTIALMVGCSRSAEEKEKLYYGSPNAESVLSQGNNSSISSSAAIPNKDTTKKFIRTANLRFRVKEVISATYKIEDVITQFEGYVTSTNLRSMVERRTLTPISPDSSLENTYYSVVNEMIIRIPNAKLDSSLKAMASLMEFLDYREIKAEDVTISLMANQIAEKRLNEHQKRLTTAIDSRGKKLNETLNAEESLLSKQTLSDKAKMSNRSMLDQVSFSTINLSIYQRQGNKIELIKNDKTLESYKPNLFYRIKDSIITGWEVLEHILVFLIKIWEIVLLAVILFLTYKKLYKKL